MSLNFYAEISTISIDSKDNVVIKLKTGSLDKQLDKLNQLKRDSVVHLLVESAMLHFDKKVDVDTGEEQTSYAKNDDGVWTTIDNQQTSLDLGEDEKAKMISMPVKITADIVDDFILQQQTKVPYKGVIDPHKVIAEISEGYELDQIASDYAMTTLDLLKDLNQARDYYAPYAAAWVDELNKAAKKKSK